MLQRWHVKDNDLTKRDLLADEVDVNLDVLRSTMLNRVAGHVNSTDVDAEDNSRRAERPMKLGKKLSKPITLSYSMSHGSVLGLGTRTRYRGLAFRGPGHQVISKVDTIARSRPTSVREASPVSIRVRCERHSRGRVKPKTKIQRALEIPKNLLDEVEMRLTRCVHVKTCLLHYMRNVGAHQCEILKGARETVVLGGVTPQNRHLTNYSNYATIRTMSLWKRPPSEMCTSQHTH
jgi:hypothetical protein